MVEDLSYRADLPVSLCCEVLEELQNRSPFDQAVFAEGIKKVSQRDYDNGLERLPVRLDSRKAQSQGLG